MAAQRFTIGCLVRVRVVKVRGLLIGCLLYVNEVNIQKNFESSVRIGLNNYLLLRIIYLLHQNH